MERCRICILPRSYSAVTFDHQGVCSLCRERAGTAGAEPADLDASGEGELEAIVGEARSQAGRYDCIVPVSGGQDSAYAAYLMRRRFGLRVLCVNFDNGYRSAAAVTNLERLSAALPADLVTLGLQPGLLNRTYAHFLRQTGYPCTACNALGYVVIGSFAVCEARLRGAPPLVVGGWSKKYEYQPGLSVLSMKSFGEVLRRDGKLFAELRDASLVEPAVLDAFASMEDIRQVLGGDSVGGSQRLPLRAIHLPNYLDWDYREIAPLLERELGWRRPDRRQDAHFDCRLAPLQEWLKCRRFGFGQMTIKNSVLVRQGRMSRREALERAQEEQRSEPEVLEEVLGSWGVPRSEVAWDAEWAG
jgi:hypothetical protein